MVLLTHSVGRTVAVEVDSPVAAAKMEQKQALKGKQINVEKKRAVAEKNANHEIITYNRGELQRLIYNVPDPIITDFLPDLRVVGE